MEAVNTIKSYFRRRWALFGILLVFVIFKVPHLFYPYFFDESWWYLPAVKLMYAHGPSLLPTAIDPEYSRGHPLLFHSLYAVWMRVFGTSRVAMHSLALCIALALLWVVYEAGLKLFNLRVAALSTLLIATQVMYFVQASYVLPEILVALFIFQSIYYYARERYVLTVLFLSLALFTKESALIAGFVLGMDALMQVFTLRPTDLKIKKLAATGIPVVLIGAFFLLQKQAYGWYIHPVHSGLIQLNWERFFSEFRNAIGNVFLIEYKSYFYVLFLILPAIASVVNKNIWYIVFFLLPAGIILGFTTLPELVEHFGKHKFFALFLVASATLVYGLQYFRYFINSAGRRFVFLATAFFVLYSIYCNLSFCTYRYLISGIVPVMFITAVFLDFFMNSINKRLLFPIVALIGLVPFLNFSNNIDTGIGDTSLQSFHAMDMQQHVLDYLEQKQLYDSKIDVFSEHLYRDLRDDKYGYIAPGVEFTNITWRRRPPGTQYIELDNIDSFSDYPHLKDQYLSIRADTANHLVFRTQSGKVWGEVYSRGQ